MRKCHNCGTPWEKEGRPAFKAVCDTCSYYIHSCKNCRLHDPFAHNQCISSTTEVVSDREGANYCDEFDFKVAGGDDRSAEEKKAKDAWDQMFKKE